MKSQASPKAASPKAKGAPASAARQRPGAASASRGSVGQSSPARAGIPSHGRGGEGQRSPARAGARAATPIRQNGSANAGGRDAAVPGFSGQHGGSVVAGTGTVQSLELEPLSLECAFDGHAHVVPGGYPPSPWDSPRLGDFIGALGGQPCGAAFECGAYASEQSFISSYWGGQSTDDVSLQALGAADAGGPGGHALAAQEPILLESDFDRHPQAFQATLDFRYSHVDGGADQMGSDVTPRSSREGDGSGRGFRLQWGQSAGESERTSLDKALMHREASPAAPSGSYRQTKIEQDGGLPLVMPGFTSPSASKPATGLSCSFSSISSSTDSSSPILAGMVEAMASGLTSRQVRELRRIFDSLDSNHDEVVTKIELIRMCREYPDLAKKVGLPSTIRQEDGSRDVIEFFFQTVDTDENRKISWEEFLAYYCGKGLHSFKNSFKDPQQDHHHSQPHQHPSQHGPQQHQHEHQQYPHGNEAQPQHHQQHQHQQQHWRQEEQPQAHAPPPQRECFFEAGNMPPHFHSEDVPQKQAQTPETVESSFEAWDMIPPSTLPESPLEAWETPSNSEDWRAPRSSAALALARQSEELLNRLQARWRQAAERNAAWQMTVLAGEHAFFEIEQASFTHMKKKDREHCAHLEAAHGEHLALHHASDLRSRMSMVDDVASQARADADWLQRQYEQQRRLEAQFEDVRRRHVAAEEAARQRWLATSVHNIGAAFRSTTTRSILPRRGVPLSNGREAGIE